jgi:hypothetical protein
MDDSALLKLTCRLVPADEQPADPVVFDDIVRLIGQAIATAAKDWPRVSEPAAGFQEPRDDEKRELRSLESKIESRIQESSAASQATIEKRAQTASQPNGPQLLMDQSLDAAQQLVAAVQRAILRNVAVRVVESTD